MSLYNPYHSLDADVIIIGGGVAGMTAAYCLIQKEPSLTVMVIEATDQLGGRTASKSLQINKNETCLFDIGGEWISSQQTHLIDFLHKLHIKTNTRNNTGKVIIDHEGKIQKMNVGNLTDLCNIPAKLELAKFIADFDKLCDRLPLKPELATKSMHDFINENISFKINKTLLESHILVNCGVSATDITLSFYIFLCISTHGIENLLNFNKQLRDLYIEGGAKTICSRITDFLEQDIVIVKNTKILKICCHRNDIEVSSNHGNFFSHNIIVAIPPASILEIDFTPPLPEPKRKLLGNLINGKLFKFVATYKIAFWEQAGLSATVYIFNQNPKRKPLIFCVDSSVDNKPALSGYFITNKKNTKDLILKQLAEYFGIQALLPSDFVIQSWNSGSPMCCFQSFEDVQALENPENTNRIFWAGSETSMQWFGTIAGAVLSGKKASRQVLYNLRPALLTVEDMVLLRRTNLSFIRTCNRSHNNIYKKVRSTYYQVSAVIAAVLLVVIWRKFNLTSRLKNHLL